VDRQPRRSSRRLDAPGRCRRHPARTGAPGRVGPECRGGLPSSDGDPGHARVDHQSGGPDPPLHDGRRGALAAVGGGGPVACGRDVED